MVYCSNCGSQLTLGTEKFCPQCGVRIQNQRTQNMGDISISETHGDVMGVGVSGSGNVIGNKIVVGSGTISVSEQQLAKLPDKYAESLKTFSDTLNQHLKGQQVPEDKVKEVNDALKNFAQEVQDVKPKEENNINPGKKRVLNRKFGSVIRSVLKVMPTAARIVSSLFVPLAPFSDLIGESLDKVVADYTQ